MYPLHAAQLRLAVLRLAANRAVDRAMRRLHDGPDDLEAHIPPDLVTPDWLLDVARVHHVARYHLRMHVDETNCRWCGIAAAEARAELENEDD